MSKKNELQTKEDFPLATNDDHAGFGFENSDNKDMLMPRALLTQLMSPILQERKDLEAGQVVDNLEFNVLPEKFVPIMQLPTHWTRRNPKEKDKPGYSEKHLPGQLIWRSTDPNDPRVIEEGTFKSDGIKPWAVKYMNFLVVFEGDSVPKILSFSKASYTEGRKFLTLMVCKGKNNAMFGFEYKLTSEKKEKNGNIYWVLVAKNAGKLQDEDKYGDMLYIYHQYKDLATSIKFDDEEKEEEPVKVNEDVPTTTNDDEIPF